ncbi:uncharacterized protein [Diabrotica undecimpunctata]|uniref:uncharacterized protein n=1 Tax=Diabrotica undecimpunctata TaxID=50387 RepID=UPI003B632C50
MMSGFSGEDLLKVFKELDIQLLHLNPNVVKAWFDTDDNDMKNLLNWMCVSLSKGNYISHQEVSEYNSIETPLTNEELDVKKDEIENKYPGIFDAEYNSLEIEFLEEDFILACQQERELSQAIAYNRNLEEKLTNDLTQKVKEEIESSVKLKTMQEKCLMESENLDKLNENIHDQIIKCSDVLHTFEFSPSPYFINNFDIEIFKEKVDNLLTLLRPMLEKSPDIRNVTALTNTTSFHMPFNDTLTNNLNNMHHRILHSQHRYLATAMEVEQLKAMVSYLEKLNVQSLLNCDDSSLAQSIAIKLDTKKRLCDMLEDCTKKYADHHISRTQLQYMEQEVEVYEKSLLELKDLEGLVQKLLAHYFVLKIMYREETQQIEEYEEYFKGVINYINRDMDSCIIRTGIMTDLIQKHHSTSSQERLKLSKTIVKLLSRNEGDYSIDRAFELISEFNKEVEILENKLFTPGFKDLKSKGGQLRSSIKTLQSFLISGPTHRVLLFPSELQLLIRRVEHLLKKELESVKSSMEIIAFAKKVPSRWQNYRRQLWMYFYADPNQLKFILQKLQKEIEKSSNN